MKPLHAFVVLLALSSLPIAAIADEPTGYLVIKVTQSTYTEGYKTGSITSQSFKIPLTPEFMSNFKRLPNQNSSGTGFCCGVGIADPNKAGPRFTWWIRKTNDNRWAINMWGHDIETVDGVKINSGWPGRSENRIVKNWEDIDMAYPLDFTRGHGGIKVEFTAKYISAKDTKLLDSIPSAPVQKADRTPLFEGTTLKSMPLQINCLFQEG